MNTSTARSLAKLLLLLLPICAGGTILTANMLVVTAAQSTEDSNQERKFKKKEFVGMPVRVREVRHLQSETWPNDLEIEIENVSNKPIYFINAALIFPDDPAPNGVSGIILKYGNPENLDIRRIAEADDEHLDPGQTTVLVVSEFYRKGLLANQKKTPNNLKRLVFSFDIINFGDGTAFVAGEFLDLKKKNTFTQVADPSSAQSSGERVIEDLVPKHVPIKIKIKQDKERAVKDMNNDNWTSDLELEVTNTSDKPIYLLELWVEMPEVISENGRRMGFTLRFGRADFIDFDARATPDDETIQPKQIHIFKIEERFQRGWAAYKTREHKSDPKRIEITFTQLSFGDGSGFNGGDAKPYPYVRSLRERPTRRARAQPRAIPTLEVTKSPQTKYFKNNVCASTNIDEMRTSLDFDCNNA